MSPMKAFRKEEISLPPLRLSNDKKNYLGSGTLKNADSKEFIEKSVKSPWISGDLTSKK